MPRHAYAFRNRDSLIVKTGDLQPLGVETENVLVQSALPSAVRGAEGALQPLRLFLQSNRTA